MFRSEIDGWCPFAKKDCNHGVLDEENEVFCNAYDDDYCYVMGALKGIDLVGGIIEERRELDVNISGEVNTYEQN